MKNENKCALKAENSFFHRCVKSYDPSQTDFINACVALALFA